MPLHISASAQAIDLFKIVPAKRMKIINSIIILEVWDVWGYLHLLLFEFGDLDWARSCGFTECIAFGGDRQQSPWAWLGLLHNTKCQERLRTNGITVQQKHRGSKRWMNVMLICFSRVQTVRSGLLMLAVFGCIHNLRRNLSRQLLLHFAPALLPDQKRIEGFIEIPHSLSPVLWLKSLIYCRCVPATQCLQEALGVSWCFRPRGGPKDLADWLFIATRNSMDWFFDTMQDVQRHCAQAESLEVAFGVSGVRVSRWSQVQPCPASKFERSKQTKHLDQAKVTRSMPVKNLERSVSTFGQSHCFDRSKAFEAYRLFS